MRIGSPSLVNARRKPSLIAGSGITSLTEGERSNAPEATRRRTVSTSSRLGPAAAAEGPPLGEVGCRARGYCYSIIRWVRHIHELVGFAAPSFEGEVDAFPCG